MTPAEPQPSVAPVLQDVVAIDGPSGAGKSTVARGLARHLSFAYLDTGAMYRAVTWHLLRNEITLDDESAVMAALDGVEMTVDSLGQVMLDGEDVSSHLRSREVESRVSAVSAIVGVRAVMRELQRGVATRGPVVAEGRDMASVVFPGARWKVYLDADPAERTRRRLQDFRNAGRDVSQADVREEIDVRDRLDSTRSDAPLRRTSDAIYCDTTGKDIDTVIAELSALVQGERAAD